MMLFICLFDALSTNCNGSAARQTFCEHAQIGDRFTVFVNLRSHHETGNAATVDDNTDKSEFWFHGIVTILGFLRLSTLIFDILELIYVFNCGY